MCVLCLAGPAAEECYVGRIDDDAGKGDYQQVREILAARMFDVLQISAALSKFRDSADRLVRSPWASERIKRIATELLRVGTLNAEQIDGLARLDSVERSSY
jgi:hypothetical protein